VFESLQETVLSKPDLQRLDSIIQGYILQKMVPSLSTLLSDEVTFSTIKTSELTFEDMYNILPQDEFQETDVGVYVTCEGDIKYGILFHLPLSDARKLASKLLGTEQTETLSSDARSAVAEIGNILAASFFNVVNETTGSEMMSTVPGLAIDSASTLVETPIMETAVSETFVYTFGQLQCVNSGITLSASIFQDPIDAKKLFR